jgi:hypothetical protein
MASLSEYIEAAQSYVDEFEQCLQEGDIDGACELLPVLSFAIEAMAEADDGCESS